MAELDATDSSITRTKPHLLEQLLFYAGAAALLIIMVVETLSVLGRHLSLPLIGAIEIIQSAIIVVACTSTVIATLLNAHAKVQLIINRLSPRSRGWLTRLSALLCATFFLGLAAGSAWLAHDTWNTFEESEVLHISYRPLRATVVIATIIVMSIFIVTAIRYRGSRR